MLSPKARYDKIWGKEVGGSLGRQRRRERYCPSYVHITNNHHCLKNIVAAKRPRAVLINPMEKDSDGSLPSTSNKRQDIDYFFSQPVITEANGKTKKHCVCKLCLYILLISCVHVLIFKQGQQTDCE